MSSGSSLVSWPRPQSFLRLRRLCWVLSADATLERDWVNLNAEQPLPGDDFEPAYLPSSPTSASRPYISDKQWGSDEEKVDFPSYNTSVPIPTFAQVPAPPPAYVQNAPRVLGPRFYQTSMGQSFDQATMRSDATIAPLYRQTSGSSQHSVGSVGSMSSDSGSTMRGKRWIIE